MKPRHNSKAFGPEQRRRQRGAAIVEAALLTPLLVLLLIGTVEFGLAWRASNTAASAVRAAVLQQARTGDDRLLDFHMIEQVRASVDELDSLQWVMVYRIGSADSGEPPAACLAAANALVADSGGVAGVCTAFHGTFVETASQADFVDPACSGEADVFLCPAKREASFGPGDRVGVAVLIHHEWVTGMPPGDGIDLQDHSVAYRLPGLGDL